MAHIQHYEDSPFLRTHEQTPEGSPRLKLEWVKDIESCTGAKTSSKNSAAGISAHAVLDAGFKNCCLNSGSFDGSLRNHFL